MCKRMNMSMLKPCLNEELNQICSTAIIDYKRNGFCSIYDSLSEKIISKAKVFGLQLGGNPNIVQLFDKTDNVKEFSIHPLFIDDKDYNLYIHRYKSSKDKIDLSKFNSLDEAIDDYNNNSNRKEKDQIIILNPM